jgi:hypothetical protein
MERLLGYVLEVKADCASRENEGTTLLIGPYGPLLQSVLRGGIASNWDLPVVSRGPADKWMLSLEPFSSAFAETP